MPSYDWMKQHQDILLLEERIKMLEYNMKELQEQLQNAYKRISKLHDKRDIPL